jgi:hypothetical protein
VEHRGIHHSSSPRSPSATYTSGTTKQPADLVPQAADVLLRLIDLVKRYTHVVVTATLLA